MISMSFIFLQHWIGTFCKLEVPQFAVVPHGTGA